MKDWFDVDVNALYAASPIAPAFDPARMSYISSPQARALIEAWYVKEGFEASTADGHFLPKDGDPQFPVDEFDLDEGGTLLRFPKRGWFLASH